MQIVKEYINDFLFNEDYGTVLEIILHLLMHHFH